MDHARSLIARLALIPAVALAAGCGGPTEETPPSEATLAFTMDSSIYVVTTAEGAMPSLLVSGFIQPSWSPDGGTLAMVATTDPRIIGFPPDQALSLADADGGNIRGLTAFDWPIGGQALWSPDGTSLLLLRVRSFPGASYVTRVAAAGGPETGIPSISRFGSVPSWSHDGSLIALDDGGIRVLRAADLVQVFLLQAYSPRFSPVNEDFAFTEPTTGHIHLIRPDSSADRDLHVEGNPSSWSPDGRHLAFVGTDGIYTIKSDGTGLLRIGPLNVVVSELAWSADSRRIAYVTSASSGPPTIYVALADDSDARPIVTADGACCLSWRP